MQPHPAGGVKRTIARVLLCTAAAAILTAALAFVTVSVLHLQADVVSLQKSAAGAALTLDALKARPAPSRPVFSVASFLLSYKKDSYGESYSGDAIITCDKRSDFIVILKTTLVSGGSSYTEDISYDLVIVSGGVGKYTTYDWGEPGMIKKPHYVFEVIGYFQAERIWN